jgi:hypothetical protein
MDAVFASANRRLFFLLVLIEVYGQFGNLSHGGMPMNQNAKRNLQRRKRQANRLSKREYFSAKKVTAAGKDKAV